LSARGSRLTGSASAVNALKVGLSIERVAMRSLRVVALAVLLSSCVSPPIEPVMVQANGTIFPPFFNVGGGSVLVYEVPPDKRLVIEYVEAVAVDTSASERIDVVMLLSTPTGPLQVEPLRLTPSASTGSVSSQIGGKLVRLYVDPGEKVFFSAKRDIAGTEVDVRFTLSGRLVSP
jgi:hypothetical protein